MLLLAKGFKTVCCILKEINLNINMKAYSYLFYGAHYLSSYGNKNQFKFVIFSGLKLHMYYCGIFSHLPLLTHCSLSS